VPKRSAGFLAYRETDDGAVEVLLVHPGGPFWQKKDEHAWSIPKGEYEPNESAEATAAREWSEELGLPVPGGERHDLGVVTQAGGKEVRAWAVRAEGVQVEDFVSNTFDMEWPPRSGRQQSFPEVDAARFMTLDEAREKLVRAQVDFLDRLLTALGRGAGADV
jgi:predicted NUDIX family NTP pyrophosphohydrolase